MLHFYHGVMGSSKTAQLLMQRYNYLQLGLKVALVKPAVDTRISVNTVYSRVGLHAQADIVLYPEQSLHEQLMWVSARNGRNDLPYVFIDEAQFLTEKQVEEIADLALEQGRDLFAVPGNVDSPNSVGTNGLIRDCARAVTCGMDILSEYEGLYPYAVRPEALVFPAPDLPTMNTNSPSSTLRSTPSSATVPFG